MEEDPKTLGDLVADDAHALQPTINRLTAVLDEAQPPPHIAMTSCNLIAAGIAAACGMPREDFVRACGFAYDNREEELNARIAQKD